MKKLLIIASIIAIDQLSKYLATKNLLVSPGGFFDSVTCNPFIAWGIPVPALIIPILWIVFMLLFVMLLYKSDWNTFLLIAFAGALSNGIDRVHLGCVVDFISLDNFPSFNIADMCITGGIVLFLISKQEKNN